jgi:RHS repeat-associated protein
MTDGSGAVTATTGYAVFGYTGEQHDAVTGYTDLRTRYLDPALCRFLFADTVQPNARG